MKWKVCPLSALNYQEIYQLFKLRTDVFVVEQHCPYPEIDEEDISCLHGLLFEQHQLIAYFRIIKKEQFTQIGRVIVANDFRGKRIGYELMKHAVERCPKNRSIQISAQAHLQSFYQQCGFKVMSKIFLEDGIPHIKMEYER